jgi:hypothetical protein
MRFLHIIIAWLSMSSGVIIISLAIALAQTSFVPREAYWLVAGGGFALLALSAYLLAHFVARARRLRREEAQQIA